MSARGLTAWLVRVHRALPWFAGVALLLWGLSGMLHILMSSFGPQQSVFAPPQRVLELGSAQSIDSTLRQAGITEAQAVRVVVSEAENLLQVTTDQRQPRRYFRLADGSELADHDRRHAHYVARHYLGDQVAGIDVAEMQFVTEFSDAYPAVNRLLPVWRVRFASDDSLTAYVYTETNALAAVDNDFKVVLQRLFQWFHMWSWVPAGGEWLRVALVGMFIVTLLAMVASGAGMLVLVRRRHRVPGMRGVHRLAGHVFVIPILMLAASGLWHLVHSSLNPGEHYLRMSPPMSLEGVAFPLHEQWAEISNGLSVSNVSIVQYDDGVFLYRLGLAMPREAAPQGAREIRNARFDGVSPTGPALYVDAATGRPWADGDRELALRLGERFSGLARAHVENMTLVTRFGAGYDFRNKRLPVWRLDYGAPLHASLFIDTATGVQADRAYAKDRLERWSFTYLHKWSFLGPLGRNGQNGVIAFFVLGGVLFMSVFGLRMAWQRRGVSRRRR
jgi:uncharacterized membrane protein